MIRKLSRPVSLLAAVALGFLLATQIRAEDPDPKLALARDLTKATGAEANAKIMMEGMAAQFRQMPGLPPGFVDEFMKRAKVEDIVELTVPVLVKNLQASTMMAAIAFFRSDEGKAYVGAQPAITKESMEAGQAWGIKLAQEVMAALQAPPGGG